MDLLQEARTVLERNSYRVSSFSPDQIEFEDHDLLGFVWVANSVEQLLEEWEQRQDGFLANKAVPLRRAGRKIWNLYAVLLCRGSATEHQGPKLGEIEEDFRGARKIVSADLMTPDQVIRALYPLIPIQNVGSMRSAAALERLEERLAIIPPAARQVLLKEEYSPSDLREFIKAHANK